MPTSPTLARVAVAIVLVLAVGGACAAADGIDLHHYWDQRCQGCHGHAGEFARRTLAVENGRLVGTHHRDDLDRFLRHHVLNDALVAPVSAMLMAQVTTVPLYAERCAGCHDSAAAFARRALRIRDGVLVGAASGRPVADVLASHGGLAAGDVPRIVATLTRVRQEVAGDGR